MTNTSIYKISFSFILSALILTMGLINISLTFNLAHAVGNTTNHVIAGDTQKSRIYEGLAPTMQPSDAGMHINPMPGTFEWWYFQGKFNDNSTEQITFVAKPWMDNDGGLQPYATIAITTPNGTHLGGKP